MPGRLFAVIPAAGLSRRMGRHKLLLPLGSRCVVERLLDALDVPTVAARMVVARADDEPLAAAARAAGALVVQPDVPPPEMRASVEHALREIERRFTPRDEDGWMLIPADHPVLDRGAVSAIVAAWHMRRPPIFVPTCDGRRGHPTIFQWALAREVFTLPPDCGLNRLVRAHPERVLEYEIGNRSVLVDLDTPDDYAALLREYGTAP